jgi:antitoxin Phd
MKKQLSTKRKKQPTAASSIPATRWQLQTAKARFSELFRRTRTEGPQWITKQDKEAVVMIPAEDFEALTARAKQPKSFVQFMRESPLMGSGISLERQEDYGRKVDL